MQYETIILELMSRIKALEGEVAAIKEELHTENACLDDNRSDCDRPAPGKSAGTYSKTTAQMINVCYDYGKKAHKNPSATLWAYADAAATQTNMNRNSAFMYICAVKSMLDGSIYKRGINTTAMRQYFTAIYDEFGTSGLSNAIAATRKHAAYLSGFNKPTHSITALCDEFQSKIK